MYKILKITPFGFIFELVNSCCHFNDCPYRIYIDDVFHSESAKNVVSIYGLKSGTDYKISLKGLRKESNNEINFSIKTEKLNFLINVKDYKAVGDGVSNDTSPINVAIYSAPKNATVYIPKGIYLVDEILLKSNIDIYLDRGAVLRQTTNRTNLAVLKGYQKNYDHSSVTINSSWEGHPLDCYCSLIYGKDIENVHIYGQGELDGNGAGGGWWMNPKVKDTAFRPRNLFLADSRHITVSGITSRNSASWNIHPFYCEDIQFYDLYIESNKISPNTDGLNPESCEHVEIIGCHFSVGDDCIALKSGKYFMSEHRYKPTAHVEIRNCFMENGHGGIVIGSEMSCGVKNVFVTNCYFKETDRGLRIKTRRGRGRKAIVDQIKFFNIKMEGVVHCFVVNMFYNCDPDGRSEYVKNKEIKVKDNQTPSIKNIEIVNIHAEDIAGSCVFIYGLPESKVETILIKDSSFSFAAKRINEVPDLMDDIDVVENLGIFICNGDGVHLENNKLFGDYNNIINED